MAELRAAAGQDLAGVRLLLEQAGLPTSDLTTSKPEFTVLWDDGRVVAAGALQPFGSAALMRSVVVAGEVRQLLDVVPRTAGCEATPVASPDQDAILVGQATMRRNLGIPWSVCVQFRAQPSFDVRSKPSSRDVFARKSPFLRPSKQRGSVYPDDTQHIRRAHSLVEMGQSFRFGECRDDRGGTWRLS